ncbi:nuclear transport factor 2 family protein [Flavobacteriaceae bacterium S0825]|uniref:nuclear transport factor 2 family protein n=1 Tax=Gaetbulibacter sp. S0825 TaxID=2720084 RepID=UPI00142F4D90|nr:nuclear transport factor 2 family protein [Gaetbulibacter sp. S0825]MCK0110386.1 nuclear transport factor 2 family protein [Flavobacteriaceae bacterium S0825]NIX66015.1 nuclear transport factor 2 family protein [Gaetbulibacter sp. S0825]
MKKISLYFIVFLLIVGCTQNDKRNSVITEDDRQKLTYLKEVEWPKAYREGDTVLLDRILNDDFKMVRDNGEWFTRADELNWVKYNKSDNDSFYYDIKRLSIYENGTALISGTGHIFKDSTETIYQSSNVLIKKDGIWKAITSHVSGVKDVNE